MGEMMQLTPPKERPVRARFEICLRTHAHDAALVALVLLAGWFALNWYQTIAHIVRDYSPIPKFDYWRPALYLPFYQAFDWTVLWRQHNEHRIVFPEIVFATDLLLLHGREVLPIAFGFLCYFGNWLVVVWAFWSIEPMPNSLRATGVLIAGVIIGWQGSAFNIVDSFLLQWTLTQIAVLLSLVFLIRLKETAKTRYLAAVIVSAVVATYSSANGLMLWPVLITAALVLSLPKRTILSLFIAAVLSIGLYFIGYKFTGRLSLKNLLLHPIYLVQFIATYMSMPFGALKSPRFGMHLGIITICILLVIAFVAARSGVIKSRAGIVLFGFYVFVVITGLLTAAGRMAPADPGFSNAKPPRYVSGPLVAWGVFFLLCIWFSSRWKKAAGYAAAVMIAILLLLALPKLRWWIQQHDTEFSRAQLAALAMEQGIYDPSTILGIFPDPVSIELWAKNLRDNHLSVYYKSHAKWLGRPLQQFAKKVDVVIPGQVSYTRPVRDGVEIAGWFDTSGTNFRHAQWLLFANESGQIVGFGRRLPAGLPDSIESHQIPPSIGWVGFINLKEPVKSFTTFVIDKRGLLPIGDSMPIPAERVAAGQRVGARIPGITWQMDAAWTLDGVPAAWPAGYPPQGPVYGSWSGNDANTGQLTTSAFLRPQDGCIILPVLQGARDGSLLVSLIDAADNHVIGRAWFSNGPHAWTFWRMQVPDTVKQMRVVAKDEGKGWGEWLAVAPPTRCQ